jgi:HEAT repeat protein
MLLLTLLAVRLPAQGPEAEDLGARLARLSVAEQCEAVRALARGSGPRVATALIELCRPGAGLHPAAAALAAEGLGGSGDPRAAPALLELLRVGPIAQVRQQALLGLVGTADPRTLEVLVEALADPNVRDAAALALGRLEDPRAVPELRRRLRAADPRRTHFAAVATALVRLDPDRTAAFLLEFLDPEAPPPTDSVVTALRACTASAAVRRRAVEVAGSPRAEPAHRRAALRVAAAVFDARTVSFLLGLLHGERELRVEVIEALGEIGHEFAVDPVARCLRDADRRVRLAAVAALASIRHPTATAPLLAVLGRGEDLELELWALLGLGRLGDRAALPAIATRLADERVHGRDAREILPFPACTAVCDLAWWSGRSIVDGRPPCAVEELWVHGGEGPVRTAAEREALRREIGEG